jgi:hypothetical protein
MDVTGQLHTSADLVPCNQHSNRESNPGLQSIASHYTDVCRKLKWIKVSGRYTIDSDIQRLCSWPPVRMYVFYIEHVSVKWFTYSLVLQHSLLQSADTEYTIHSPQ